MSQWPPRMKDLPDDGSPESRAGAALRNVSAPVPLTPEQLGGIQVKVYAGSRAVWPQWLRRLVTIGGFAGGGLAFAAIARFVAGPTALPPPKVIDVRPAAVVTVAPTPEEHEQFFDGLDLTVPDTPRQAAPVKRRAAPKPVALMPAVDLTPPPVVMPTVTGGQPCAASPEESNLLGTAELQLMRRDAEGSLATLDQLRRTVASPCLWDTALTYRVVALSILNRRAEALSDLEHANVSGNMQLTLWKADLLREADRCEDALPLYDLFAAHKIQKARDRMLTGRAQCRERMGDAQGAMSDAREYLKAYPDGRWAEGAQSMIR